MPRGLAEQMAAAVAQAVADPSLAEQARTLSMDYEASTPTELAAFVQAERQRWGQVVQTLGLKQE